MSSPETWMLLSVFLVVEIALLMAPASFPNSFDELAHLSYVVSVRQSGFPDFASPHMQLLCKDLLSYCGKANYLNHPPHYYWALSYLLPSNGWPTLEDVQRLRAVNLVLSTTAFFCILTFARLRKVTARQLMFMGIAIALSPVFLSISSAISNDNLAILGGSMAILGAQMMQEHGSQKSGLVLLLTGLALAGLAKFTAGLMTGVFVIMFMILNAKMLIQKHLRKTAISSMIVTGVVLLITYGPMIIATGTPVPQTPGFIEGINDVTRFSEKVFGWTREPRLGPISYGLTFAVWFVSNLAPSLSLPPLFKLSGALAPALVLPFALPRLCLSLIHRGQRDCIFAAGTVAIGSVLIIHCCFSYRLHLLLGSPPTEAYPRYYFPIALSLVPVAFFDVLQRSHQRMQNLNLYALYGTSIITLITIPIAHFLIQPS